MNVRRLSVSQWQHFLLLVIVGLVLFYPPAIGTAQTNPAPYKHAYYLFLEGGSSGCEECYVPLLITRNSLEQIAAGGRFEEGVLIITYERDSIWQDKGKVPLYAVHILSKERIVRLNGKRYRYQEISAGEVLKLLENPMGTIPISRPKGTGLPADSPILAELIAAFKNAQ
jgi:hypothetical protein